MPNSEPATQEGRDYKWNAALPAPTVVEPKTAELSRVDLTVPRRAPPAAAPPKRSRHVPAAVWRAVWARDGGMCQWPLEGGGVCGSTARPHPRCPAPP